MSSGPYTEGWPKHMSYELVNQNNVNGPEVVPLSDAERLRFIAAKRNKDAERYHADAERMKAALEEVKRDFQLLGFDDERGEYIQEHLGDVTRIADRAVLDIDAALNPERDR